MIIHKIVSISFSFSPSIKKLRFPRGSDQTPRPPGEAKTHPFTWAVNSRLLPVHPDTDGLNLVLWKVNTKDLPPGRVSSSSIYPSSFSSYSFSSFFFSSFSSSSFYYRKIRGIALLPNTGGSLRVSRKLSRFPILPSTFPPTAIPGTRCFSQVLVYRLRPKTTIHLYGFMFMFCSP